MSDKGKILAVDDTPANLEVIGDTLSDAGYAVVAAIDGERALKRLQNYQPDLILLDIQMPGIDGFETCRQIKSNPETAAIPIIFITAFSDLDSKVKGFALGGVDYITKPFQEQEMLARVDTHLRLYQLNQNLEAKVSKRTSKLEAALEQLQEFQLQLVQSEKMAALGNLVAGIAHEINNPLVAISGNTSEMKLALAETIEVLQMYRDREPYDLIQEREDEIEIEYLLDDIPKTLNSISLSCDRLRDISMALRTFSRRDTDAKTEFNLHQGLDSTLLILKYRLKANEKRPEIAVIKDYGNIPELECYPGQINQVFMNILANAIDMFDESSEDKSYAELVEHPQEIAIATRLTPGEIVISIRDNGKGMSAEAQAKIFDRGFTTKTVEKGTGLGMAIARKIITEKHGGTLTCRSELGQGTELTLVLPVATQEW